MLTLRTPDLKRWCLVAAAAALAGCAPQSPQPPAAQKTSSSDCVRGEPEPLLRSNSSFNKTSKSEAVEAVDTQAPLKLTIRHFGCAHYALDFEFTWPQQTMPAPAVSLTEAADLLQKLPVHATYTQVMKSLADGIRKMAQHPYEQPFRLSETETLTATTPALNVLRIRYDVAL